MPQNPHETSAESVRNHRPAEAQYVRQGRGAKRIFVVLAAGLAMTALGFGLVWAFWAGPFAAAPVDNGDQAEDAAAFQDGERRIPLADAPTSSTGEPTRPPTGKAPNVNSPVANPGPQDP